MTAVKRSRRRSSGTRHALASQDSIGYSPPSVCSVASGARFARFSGRRLAFFGLRGFGSRGGGSRPPADPPLSRAGAPAPAPPRPPRARGCAVCVFFFFFSPSPCFLFFFPSGRRVFFSFFSFSD